jgi:phytoene dehydrogenase-like protein
MQSANTSQSMPIVVIGAGHNGLVAAAYLARAGHSVTVLERRKVIGGASVTEELIPGFRSSSCAYVSGLLHPRILRDLQLESFGLELYATDISDANILPDGRHLFVWNDLGRTLRELEVLRRGESERFLAFGLRLERFAQLFSPFLLGEAPRLSEVVAAFEAANESELFGEFFTLSIKELLERYLELDVLKGLLTFLAMVSVWGGPSTPGLAYVYGHHSIGEFDGHMGRVAFARGGMGAIASAVADCARAHGAIVRTEAEARRIVTENGRVVGVELQNGELVRAEIVLSNADPKRTYCVLLDENAVPARAASEAKAFDVRGSMGRVHIALDGLPTFSALPRTEQAHFRGLTLLGADIDRFEAAWQEQLAGKLPRDPVVEFTVQSVHDDTLAPRGKHILVTGVQQLPFELSSGNWDDAKGRLTNLVLDAISAYAPDLKDHVIGTYTITPLDLEREYGLTGGNIFHGAMTLSQLFASRPLPQFGHRSPIEGLYLCSAGTHPGGGVMGAPGYNAAAAVLTDIDGRTQERTDQRNLRVQGSSHRPIVHRLLEQGTIRRFASYASRQRFLSPLIDRFSKRRTLD